MSELKRSYLQGLQNLLRLETIQMITTITIDDRATDTIVVQHLSNWRAYLIQENKALKQIESLKPHQKEDYRSNKKYIKALNLVIDAYTWPEK